jgi:uncharacterized protein (DUF2147 family)
MKGAAGAIVAGLALCAGASCGAAAEDAPGDELLGQWYTEDDESKVEVIKTDGKYFGTIIWLSEPNYEADDAEAGRPKRDRENPDAAKRNDPVIGIQVLKNFHYVPGDQTWEGGTIYDPANGRTYKCVIRFKDDPKGVDGKSLHVRGYIGIPTLGRTTVWYRVPQEEMEPSAAKE